MASTTSQAQWTSSGYITTSSGSHTHAYNQDTPNLPIVYDGVYYDPKELVKNSKDLTEIKEYLNEEYPDVLADLIIRGLVQWSF